MAAAPTPLRPARDRLALAPFRALRYATARFPDVSALTSPPYDVIDEAARRRLEALDPHNVVRLILPRDREGAPGSRYRVAAERLRRWRRDGVLQSDERAALYVYEEAGPAGPHRHVQRGLVGALRLLPPEAGVILPHESTMAAPVADRLALTAATEANLEAIVLVYDGGGAAAAAVAAVDATAPSMQARTEDGVEHRIWALPDPDTWRAVADDLGTRRAVIADGHHRYATYLRHQADRRAAGAGAGPWDEGLACLVDASAFGPRVEPIHRVMPTVDLGEALHRAAGAFTVERLPAEHALEALAQAGAGGPAFLLVGRGSWNLLTAPDRTMLDRAVPADRSAAWRGLDVTVAHSYLIPEVLGVTDTEERVGFAHDVTEALRLAGDGIALLLNATPVEAVTAVAAAGDRMPRKSTLFVPKPRTGLLMRSFDP